MPYHVKARSSRTTRPSYTSIYFTVCEPSATETLN